MRASCIIRKPLFSGPVVASRVHPGGGSVSFAIAVLRAHPTETALIQHGCYRANGVRQSGGRASERSEEHPLRRARSQRGLSGGPMLSRFVRASASGFEAILHRQAMGSDICWVCVDRARVMTICGRLDFASVCLWLCTLTYILCCWNWRPQDLPVSMILQKLKARLLAILRLLLLEGRVLFYSKSAASVSEAGEMSIIRQASLRVKWRRT